MGQGVLDYSFCSVLTLFVLDKLLNKKTKERSNILGAAFTVFISEEKLFQLLFFFFYIWSHFIYQVIRAYELPVNVYAKDAHVYCVQVM